MGDWADTVRNLRYLMEVVRSGGFTPAALRLGMSPSALSKAVSRAEAQLGARLLERNTRFVRLSDDGRRLVEQIGGALDLIDHAMLSWSVQLEPKGTVQVSTVTGFGRNRLLPILPEFFDRFPEVELRIGFHDGQRGVSRSPSDVRITWGEKLDDDKVAHTLCHMPLILAASPAYLARYGAPERPADLSKHHCIVMVFPSGTQPDWTFHSRVAERGDPAAYVLPHPTGRLTITGELSLALDAGRNGLGIVVANADAVASDLARGGLVPVLPDYEVSTGDPGRGAVVMQYRPRAHLSAPAVAFVDFMIEKFPAHVAAA